MRELRAWAYEIFGYLYPGLTATLAGAVFFWAIWCPRQPLVVARPSVEFWIALALLSYVVGHLVQGIGNIVVERLRWVRTETLKYTGDLPQAVVNAVKERLKSLARLSDVPGSEVYTLCDRVLADRGKLGDREMFVYHEGFYRGHMVSCALLSVAMFLRSVHPPRITILGVDFVLARGIPLVIGVGLIGATFLCAIRYRRFMAYRISQGMLAVLVLTGQTVPAAQSSNNGENQ